MSGLRLQLSSQKGATGRLGLALAIRLGVVFSVGPCLPQMAVLVCPWQTGGLSKVGPLQVLASLSSDCVSGEASGSFVPELWTNGPVTLQGPGVG